MRTVINHATILTMDSEKHIYKDGYVVCLLYTSDAADE